MNASDILVDGFERVRDGFHPMLGGLSAAQLAFRPGPEANSIGWLAWHLTRVQDAQVADIAGTDQVWTSGGWADRFDLPLPDDDTGYGHGPGDVDLVVAPVDLLLDYHEATHARTVEVVSSLGDTELERIIDVRWNPPVSVAVRLMSIVADDLQHIGQGAYLRGLLPPH